MKKRRFHILPLIFLTFLLLPFISSIVLQSAQGYLKAYAQERMEKEDLVTISLPATAVNWEERGKELWVDGKLFDIKNFSVTAGMLTATGFYDDEEQNLVNILFAWRKNNRNSFVSVFLLLQCFTAVMLFFSVLFFYRSNTFIYSFYSLILPQPHLLILGQPPDC